MRKRFRRAAPVPAEQPTGQERPKRGWVALSPLGETGLPDDLRAEVRGRIEQNRVQRGDLLAVVEVRVFENGAEAQVSFPPEGLLGPDSDSDVIADVVARAREQLASWR